MAVSREFRQLVESRLESLVPLRTKPMFGGLGLYSEELFFALADDDRLYFKTDALTSSDYDALKAEYWLPYPGAKPGAYRELPSSIWSDDTELRVWIDKAVGVAERAASKKTGVWVKGSSR